MWLERLWQDVRHGIRLFAKSPGFTAIAVLSIACGTGANVAMFSTADAYLLRPLPIRDASSLITVGALEADSVAEIVVSSYPDYADIRARTRTLEWLVAFHSLRAGIGADRTAPRQVRLVTAVSGNFFDDFGVRVQLGRGFLADEDRVAGRNPVVVLSHGLWQRMFGGDLDAIGRTLAIAGTIFTVVGVAGEEFIGVEGATLPESAYIPLAMLPALMNAPEGDPLQARDLRILTVKARLREAATLGEARAEMAAIGKDLERAYPATNARRSFVAQTELQARLSRGPVVGPLIILLSTLALAVLGVACANVAGLLTSRAPLRAREISLRLALGASRGRLVAQLLTESLAIAVAGGLAGIAVGYAGIVMIRQLQLPTDLIVLPVMALDRRALTFSLVVAMTSAVVFGLGPALSTTRIDLANALRVADAGGRRRWRVTGRNTLVTVQVALSLAVLTVALITLQTFIDAFAGGPGFRTTRMAMLSLDAGQAGYTGERAVRFFERVAGEARQLPGVRSASVTSAMPLWEVELAKIDGTGGDRGRDGWMSPPLANVVDDDYFATMEIPVLRGRGFAPADAASATPVAVVNETMARRYWPGQEAVGRRLRMAGPAGLTDVEIVGVARDSLYLYPAEQPQNMIYFPLRQHPRTRMTVLAQTAGPSAGPLPALRDAIRRIDAAVPVYDGQTVERFYDAIAVSVARVVLSLVSGIGLMGVTITVIGLYGLVSFAVNRRTREIGIRVAIGATYARIMRLLLSQGLTPAWVGIAVGMVLSVATVRVLGAVAPFSPAYDVWAVAALVPTLFAVTLLAAYVPARRAAIVNPIEALRDE